MPDGLTPALHPLGLGAPTDPDDDFVPLGYIKPPGRFGPPTFGPGAYAPGKFNPNGGFGPGGFGGFM